MKTLQISLLSFLFILGSHFSFAQTKTEKFKVSGECNTCKKKIETAAKKAGASYAFWDKDSKVMTIKYDAASSNTTKIQQSIANAGYDTPQYRASDDAYNNLDDCCKYDRDTAVAATDKCDSKACADMKCMKDGKCQKDMSCCKDSDCSSKDCCKKS